MTSSPGEWRLVQAPDEAFRYDWIPFEQPPPPNGHPGVWHVVGADAGSSGWWEWVPDPRPAPAVAKQARVPKAQRVIAVGLVVAAVAGFLVVQNRADDDALARLANTEETAAPEGPKQATNVDVSKSITSNPLLKGNISPTYPAGGRDEVAVVTSGRLVQTVGAEMVVVVRNNTSKPVASVQVSAAGRDMGGTIVVTGAAQGSYPPVLGPGELGLAYVVFSQRVRSDLDFTFATSSSAPADGPGGDAGGKISEVNRVGPRLLGTITNATGRSLQGPYSVALFCFTSTGTPTTVHYGYEDLKGTVAPGAVRTFSLRIFGDDCKRFVVGTRTFFA